MSSTAAVPSVNSSPPVRSTTPTSLKNDMRSPTNINERLANLTQGLPRPKPTSGVGSDPVVNTNGGKPSPTISGPTPSRSMTAPPEALPSAEKRSIVPLGVDKDNVNTLVTKPPTSPPLDPPTSSPLVNTTEFPTYKSPRASLSLDDPTPIKPTPIHHRVPQSGFSVTSRPQRDSTHRISVSTILSINSTQRQAEAETEPLDSIGDFTAAMFSQLDMGFATDETRELSDGTVKKGATTTMTTKSTSPPLIPSKQLPPLGPKTRAATPTRNVGGKQPPPTRSVPSDVPQPHTSTSEATTSGKTFRRPKSSTPIIPASSQTPRPPGDQPQSQPMSRPQPPRSVKSTPDVSGSRKAVMTSKTQPAPPTSRRKQALSTASTSSESSFESSSPVPPVVKQRQPPVQSRPPQSVSRPRSATMSTLITAISPSPTNSSNNSSSSAFHRPPQRPFAMRDNSPSSSTGDSSSGRLPTTPRDGSELGSELGRGIRAKRQTSRTTESLDLRNDTLLSTSNTEMGLKAKKLSHRKSASYDDSTLKAAMKGGGTVTTMNDEERRRERRRSEAKNAIEVAPHTWAPLMSLTFLPLHSSERL